MRQIAFLLLALISLASAASAARRPHYGGTLRVAIQSAPSSLDLPTLSAPTDYWEMAHVLSLVGETLVNIDVEGRPQPALAVAWQEDSSARHWQFTLRRGIKFHDGSHGSPSEIAKILGGLHPEWNVRPSADSLTIDVDTPAPSLLAELAMPRDLILKRNGDGVPVGTGPFRVAEFQPGKILKLAANEDNWAGRPFVDMVEIEFAKSLREQALSLELARADIVEVAPGAASLSARTRTSFPVELMLLVFPADSKAQDLHLHEALALSIDRKPIQSVLLKGAGEPTACLLPNWMTGYSTAFSTQTNLQRARMLVADARHSALSLSYDPRDPEAQLIAERIALNARDAGIAVQVSLSGADIRLMRMAVPSPDPAIALGEIARQLSLSQPPLHGNTVEDLYQLERALLAGGSVIPLFHLPLASTAASRVRGWAPDRLGDWNLANVWLENAGLENSGLENMRFDNSGNSAPQNTRGKSLR